MHTAPGACLQYAPGAVCLFVKYGPGTLFNLEYSSRLLMVLDRKSRPKSQESRGGGGLIVQTHMLLISETL